MTIEWHNGRWVLRDGNLYRPSRLPSMLDLPVSLVAQELAQEVRRAGLRPEDGRYIGTSMPFGLRWEASC